MELTMLLTVNGKKYNPDAKYVDEMLKQLKLKASSALIGKNGLIAHKEKFQCTAVEDGDRIGIIRFTGGG
jgi:thiamine biosynthesis protein ThiS